VLVQPPLTGEPVALELVNTEWNERGRRQDLLADAAHARRWLRTAGLPDRTGDEELACLRTARSAIRTAVADLSDPGAFAAADEVLARGRLRLSVSGGRTHEELELTDECWAAAWLAVRNLAELLGTHPDRIRACAHPDCILYFLDTTRQGTRKWCSMSTCGNRAKSMRNYRRTNG
jgi:predicted RNA-binding Zn ribbon-like protein